MSAWDGPVAPVVPIADGRAPRGTEDPPKVVVEFDGYFKKLATAGADGELLLTFGVPFDQGDLAWPLRALTGYTVRIHVEQP